jgi:hypothetical protein
MLFFPIKNTQQWRINWMIWAPPISRSPEILLLSSMIVNRPDSSPRNSQKPPRSFAWPAHEALKNLITMGSSKPKGCKCHRSMHILVAWPCDPRPGYAHSIDVSLAVIPLYVKDMGPQMDWSRLWTCKKHLSIWLWWLWLWYQKLDG